MRRSVSPGQLADLIEQVLERYGLNFDQSIHELLEVLGNYGDLNRLREEARRKGNFVPPESHFFELQE